MLVYEKESVVRGHASYLQDSVDIARRQWIAWSQFKTQPLLNVFKYRQHLNVTSLHSRVASI